MAAQCGHLTVGMVLAPYAYPTIECVSKSRWLTAGRDPHGRFWSCLNSVSVGAAQSTERSRPAGRSVGSADWMARGWRQMLDRSPSRPKVDRSCSIPHRAIWRLATPCLSRAAFRSRHCDRPQLHLPRDGGESAGHRLWAHEPRTHEEVLRMDQATSSVNEEPLVDSPQKRTSLTSAKRPANHLAVPPVRRVAGV